MEGKAEKNFHHRQHQTPRSQFGNNSEQPSVNAIEGSCMSSRTQTGAIVGSNARVHVHTRPQPIQTTGNTAQASSYPRQLASSHAHSYQMSFSSAPGQEATQQGWVAGGRGQGVRVQSLHSSSGPIKRNVSPGAPGTRGHETGVAMAHGDGEAGWPQNSLATTGGNYLLAQGQPQGRFAQPFPEHQPRESTHWDYNFNVSDVPAYDDDLSSPFTTGPNGASATLSPAAAATTAMPISPIWGPVPTIQYPPSGKQGRSKSDSYSFSPWDPSLTETDSAISGESYDFLTVNTNGSSPRRGSPSGSGSSSPLSRASPSPSRTASSASPTMGVLKRPAAPRRRRQTEPELKKICPTCQKCISVNPNGKSWSNYHRHQRTKHGDSSGNPCSIPCENSHLGCQSTFTRKDNMKWHLTQNRCKAAKIVTMNGIDMSNSNAGH